MQTEPSLTTEMEYEAAMKQLHIFADKTCNGGARALSEEEVEVFGRLALAVERYEKQHYPFPTRDEVFANSQDIIDLPLSA